jgi:hypothetical protein
MSLLQGGKLAVRGREGVRGDRCRWKHCAWSEWHVMYCPLTSTYGSSGIAILAVTLPVVMSAALTMPSVPAEYNCEPSTPKPSALQLPLCRRVFHVVSISPNPFSEASVSSPSSSSLGPSGRRKVWTWPEASPTETIGSSGWIAWVKTSWGSGRVQTFSNMAVDCRTCDCPRNI